VFSFSVEYINGLKGNRVAILRRQVLTTILPVDCDNKNGGIRRYLSTKTLKKKYSGHKWYLFQSPPKSAPCRKKKNFPKKLRPHGGEKGPLRSLVRKPLILSRTPVIINSEYIIFIGQLRSQEFLLELPRYLMTVSTR
jgi:hypothetical protein